jgi:hypothetical protein
VSPDRTGVEPYAGVERRRRNRRVEDRPPIKHGPFTTWQWAVLAVLMIAVVGSVFVGQVAATAVTNTQRIDRALCTQIAYLEKQSVLSETTEARINLKNFAASLRPLVPSCPPPHHALRG